MRLRAISNNHRALLAADLSLAEQPIFANASGDALIASRIDQRARARVSQPDKQGAPDRPALLRRIPKPREGAPEQRVPGGGKLAVASRLVAGAT